MLHLSRRHGSMWTLALILGVVGLAGPGVGAASAEPALVESYLHAGKFAEGEAAALAHLKEHPEDAQARFGLGVLQFVRAIERFAQSSFKYGLRSERGRRMNIPFLRIPVPENTTPERFTYPAARKMLEDLVADLKQAEATLALVKDEHVKLPLQVGLIKLDPNGDGKAEAPFSLLLSQYLGGRDRLPNTELAITFDRGDVAWLRGYCHLLSALAEIALGYNGQELFDATAHLFFTKVETPHRFLVEPGDGEGDFSFFLGDGVNFLDVIALIHLIRMPVEDEDRLKSALSHLEQMCVLSRESWKAILAEEDDDHEWLPNPKQKGILGVPVREEMITSWLEFVDEAELLLAGKRLAPFWRGSAPVGVNVRRIFTEPRPLDLVLWAQGTAATPYLEKGEMTRPEVWTRLGRVFGGEFIGFAIWFN